MQIIYCKEANSTWIKEKKNTLAPLCDCECREANLFCINHVTSFLVL